MTVKKVSNISSAMLIFHFSRFSKSIYLQEWLVSFSRLNEVLNAEHVSVGDKYVLADQRS